MILYTVSDRGAFSKRAGRKIVEICRTWRELGYEVELTCGGDLLPESARPATGTPVVNKPSRFQSTVDLRGWHAPLVHSVSEWRDLQHDRQLAVHLRKVLGPRVPSLVWHRASRLHLAPLELAQELGVPYVLEWIDQLLSYRVSLFHGRAAAADRRRMQEAHRVVVTSAYWKQEIADEYDIPLGRIVVSHNAVEPSEFVRDPAAGAAVRAEEGIPPDALVVGFVGSYGWYHDADLVAPAAALLRQRLEKPVYFLMVGDGPKRAVLDEEVERLGVADLVKRRGAAPFREVPSLLSAMDAAVVPNNGGPRICPMKVQEYMAAQVAPVVAESPANREVVTEGETGLLFANRDPVAMAGAIEKLAREPGLAAALGRAARADVERRFTWRATFGRALQEIHPPGSGETASEGT